MRTWELPNKVAEILKRTTKLEAQLLRERKAEILLAKIKDELHEAEINFLLAEGGKRIPKAPAAPEAAGDSSKPPAEPQAHRLTGDVASSGAQVAKITCHGALASCSLRLQ